MNYTKVSVEEAKKWLKEHLTEKRYNHSIGTADCAKELALKFNIDPEKAYIAGLLHDCAKCFPTEELIDIINKHLEVDPLEMISYKTLHAPVSAYIAKKEFGVTDEEILSSIRWHTMGNVNMSDFEKIIFIADKVETVTRHKEYLDGIRVFLSEKDGLNKAMLACYKETIKSLVDRNLYICPIAVDIYNHLQNLLNVN